jgi:hypothetical protein
LVTTKEVTYGGGSSEMELRSRNGNFGRVGFCLEKGEEETMRVPYWELRGLRDGADFFELCFMGNHLGCEFQFGT